MTSPLKKAAIQVERFENAEEEELEVIEPSEEEIEPSEEIEEVKPTPTPPKTVSKPKRKTTPSKKPKPKKTAKTKPQTAPKKPRCTNNCRAWRVFCHYSIREACHVKMWGRSKQRLCESNQDDL